MIDGVGRDWSWVIEERQRLFLRRDTHINDVTEDHWRAGDHGRDMAIDLGNPMFGPGSAVGGDDIGAVVGAESGFNITDDDIIAMDGGTVAGDRPGDAIVVGDLVRPDQLARLFVDREQVSRPIGKENIMTGHRRSRRDVCTGGEDPFDREQMCIGRPDQHFRRLVA